MTTNKQKLREQLRSIRRNLPEAHLESAADAVCANALKLNYFQSANNIALYWPHDNELSPLPLLRTAINQGKNCFLPVLWLKTRQTLAFARYTLDTPLVRNRYQILEPDLNYAPMIEVAKLDLIFMPLIGFDRNGGRLGQGGGFYDAACSDLARENKSVWPKLVGLAYACQEIESIPQDSWDWRLDTVVTEQDVFEF